MVTLSKSKRTEPDFARQAWQRMRFIRKRCNKKGWEVNLTVDDAEALICQPFCHYTGMQMTNQLSVMDPMKATDVSFDRVDNAVGYMKKNVVACCYFVNHMKSKFEDPMKTGYEEDQEIRMANFLEALYHHPLVVQYRKTQDDPTRLGILRDYQPRAKAVRGKRLRRPESVQLSLFAC